MSDTFHVRLTCHNSLLLLASLLSACGGGASAPVAGPSTQAAMRTTLTPQTLPFDQLMGESGNLNAQELAAAAHSARNDGADPAATAPSRKVSGSLTPVYRFFNTTSKSHFYTATEAERNHVINRLPTFNYEGIAFYTSAVPARGLSPVYRFYNASTGVHLYTITESEKIHIESNIPSYRYEGISYYTSKTLTDETAEVRRFYVKDRKFHFYSSDITESDFIRRTFLNYADEGPAFYSLKSSWTMPTPVDVTGSWLISATGNSNKDWSGSVMTFESAVQDAGHIKVEGSVNLLLNGAADGYQRFTGAYHPDGRIDLATYAVSTKYGVFPEYKATLNVAGNQLTTGTRLSDVTGTWSATRMP